MGGGGGGGGCHTKFVLADRGGCKNIAGVFSDIYDPPIPKKMVAPLDGSKWFSGVFGSFVLTCYMEPSWFPFSDL